MTELLRVPLLVPFKTAMDFIFHLAEIQITEHTNVYTHWSIRQQRGSQR
jgi:hypothetical protein